MKFKHTGLFAAIVMAIFIIFGCTGMQRIIFPECGDDTTSVITKLIPNPHTADLVLILANFTGLEEGVYSKEQADNFFNKMETAIVEIKTYSDLAAYIIKEIEPIQAKLGPYMILVSPYISLFVNQELPISDYDRCLLLKHIESQRSKVMVNFK